MKVYVVEQGSYENTWVGGVYSSPEKAMAAHKIRDEYKYPETPSAHNLSRRGGWVLISSEDGTRYWDNQLDWDNAACIREYELDE